MDTSTKKDLTGVPPLPEETVTKIKIMWIGLAGTVLAHRDEGGSGYAEVLTIFMKKIGDFLKPSLMTLMDKVEIADSSLLGCTIQAPLPIYLITAEPTSSDNNHEYKIEAQLIESIDYAVDLTTRRFVRCRLNLKTVGEIGTYQLSEDMLELIDHHLDTINIPLIDMYVNEDELGFTKADIDKILNS